MLSSRPKYVEPDTKRAGRDPKDEASADLAALVKPMIESFDWFLDTYEKSFLSIRPISFQVDDDLYAVDFQSVHIAAPRVGHKHYYPSDAREGKRTYCGNMRVSVRMMKMPKSALNQPLQNVRGRSVANAQTVVVELKSFAQVPIMTKSRLCVLKGMSPEELMRRREDPYELGGTFVVNGLLKLIRMTVLNRRNTIQCVIRPQYQRRRAGFSEFAANMACTRVDGSALPFTCHYLKSGGVVFRIVIGMRDYYFPAALLLKCFCDCADQTLFERIVLVDASDSAMPDRVEYLLSESRTLLGNGEPLTRDRCLRYVGRHFRTILSQPDNVSDVSVGRLLLHEYVLIHLSAFDGVMDDDDNDAKFDVAIEMVRRVYRLASGRIKPDNADAPSQWEALQAGHLYMIYFRERMSNWLRQYAGALRREMSRAVKSRPAFNVALGSKLSAATQNVGDRLSYFLATGNVITASSVNLMQTSGFVVIAENINFLRYISHFRALHRGSFFTEMRTTTVRKLLPEAWGFVCPVHTPDGAPCGLLNHLAAECILTPAPLNNARLRRDLIDLLRLMGVMDHETTAAFFRREAARLTQEAALGKRSARMKRLLPVLVDGLVVGHVSVRMGRSVASRLRAMKREPVWLPSVRRLLGDAVSDKDAADAERNWAVDAESIPAWTEVALSLPPSGSAVGPAGQLLVLTNQARMMRPVRSLVTGRVELLGSLEQIGLEVACDEATVRRDATTHIELAPGNILSMVASLTPFSDFNQSPRNMYQCQMAKQTMGTPCYNYKSRLDSKVYRLATPQAPITRTADQERWRLNNYPTGTNAVVAVVSYTGYDMEDAMIVCKSSMERGMAHGFVYATKHVEVDAHEALQRPPPGASYAMARARCGDHIGGDGLPRVGERLASGDTLYAKFNYETMQAQASRLRDTEAGVVDTVRVIDTGSEADGRLRKASITLRRERNPVIGDKFSSRHGQKGTLAQLWPQHNMPVSECGIVPDIIINPHAFPSRMTIGMLIESMAGKAGALHGRWQDSTPFAYGALRGDVNEPHEQDTDAVKYFGEQLKADGFQYYGSEPMYSGTTGVEMTVNIFQGIVYYQRLRHMVKDKFQVRETGPINAFTRQPIKGRKRHGGIRFGEMERDALISYGAAFLLNDRLFRSSDFDKSYVCGKCGSLLSVRTRDQKAPLCDTCQTTVHVRAVAVPFVFRFMANELAAMNIAMKLTLKAH